MVLGASLFNSHRCGSLLDISNYSRYCSLLKQKEDDLRLHSFPNDHLQYATLSRCFHLESDSTMEPQWDGMCWKILDLRVIRSRKRILILLGGSRAGNYATRRVRDVPDSWRRIPVLVDHNVVYDNRPNSLLRVLLLLLLPQRHQT